MTPSPQDTERTHRVARQSGKVVDLQTFTLAVLEGPDAGRTFTVEARTVRIGKGTDCDIRLADTSVSRAHAVISPTPQGFLLEDLGSTNGTEVDGVLVKSAVLRQTCKVRVGDTVLSYTPGSRRLLVVPTSAGHLEGLLGTSPIMRAAYGLIRQVAPTEATVVIHGETGSGKEVAARAIHALSTRKAGPFVVFDCANVNRDLLGSELFGHKKGSFTGALADHKGAFDRASGGTLFLDEIGELPQDIQSRLLGVLQRREVLPLGADSPHSVDVRVVAATHRDLEGMSRTGGFREDLYFRLAVITMDLPPLRERLDDLPQLADSFIAEFAGPADPRPRLTPEALEVLRQNPWRGNVRELRNVIQRAVVFCAGSDIRPEHLGNRLGSSRSGEAPVAVTAAPSVTSSASGEFVTHQGPGASPASAGSGEPTTLAEVEKRTILQALGKNQGNKSRTARDLGIALSTLKRKLREYGLDTDDDEAD